MKLNMKIKNVGFDLLKVTIGQFHGCGLSFLEISWSKQGKVCLIGDVWTLFSVGIYYGMNDSVIFSICTFGLRVRKYIKPQKIKVCATHSCKLEYDHDTGYYCDECEDWLSEIDIKVIEKYCD